VARRANKKEKKRAMGVSAANVSLITARKKKKEKHNPCAHHQQKQQTHRQHNVVSCARYVI